MTEQYNENTGFLDDVVAYYPPLKTGFISIPVSDSAKYGWEKPFTQPPGNVVSKEDKGDAKTKVLFQWKSSSQEWKVKRGLNLEYGNIEFIQKFATDGSPLKTPLIVTFDGPLNRHMLGDDNFYVESGTPVFPVPNPLSKNVYMKGKILAAFPYNVIGVCIRQSVNGKKWLVVATKYGPTVIQFYRYQVGKKDSQEVIGTISEENPVGGVASVVHFSDSGAQAVAYTRVIDSVATGFFGASYPSTFDVFCARRIMIQISYDNDTPTGISFTATKTHEISAGTAQNVIGGCGISNNTLVKSVSFSQEIAGEFQGETLKTARVTASFSITNNQRNTKKLWHTQGLYRDIYTYFGLDTSGPGSVGDPCFCEGVPSGTIYGCSGSMIVTTMLCTQYLYYMVQREIMIDFTVYLTSLTIGGVNVDSKEYPLAGSNSTSCFFDCGESFTSPDPPPGTSEIVATIGPEEGAFTPNICVNWKIITKYSQYPGTCDRWDPPPPPLPGCGAIAVNPEGYRPVNIVLLDMKRGNYLIRKCVDPVAETGLLKGVINGSSVSIPCHHRGNAMDHRFAQDVGYGYHFYTTVGSPTGGVFDGRYAWEYPAQYPDDNPQIRLGYAVDGYDHVFCCASEPYDVASGISLYPVYAYLSGTDPVTLNQSVGSGARFKKIGVL